MSPLLRNVLIGIAVLIVAVALIGEASAQAQFPCRTRDEVLAMLEKKYNEVPVYIASVGESGKAIAEVTLSDQGTWSLVVTLPTGCAGIGSAGLNWQKTGNEPGVTGQDS